MPEKKFRTLEIPSFRPELEAEFKLVIRAFRDSIRELGISKEGVDTVGLLVERLLREAVRRFGPNRSIAYLEQWSNFLARTTDQLRERPEKTRSAFLAHCLANFRLYDAKGRKGPERREMHPDANVWIRKDGQRWEAQAAPAVADDTPLIELTDMDAGPPHETRKMKNIESVPSQVRLSPPGYDIPHAKPLRPTNTPELLLQYYEHIYQELELYPDPRHSDVRKMVLTDVPEVWLRRWFAGHITRSNLALLAAAHRVGLTPSIDNLSSLRESVAGARLARKRVADRTEAVKEPLLVGKIISESEEGKK
jgi:hypothetical protein